MAKRYRSWLVTGQRRSARGFEPTSPHPGSRSAAQTSGAFVRSGSQVGSHSLWTGVDGCGRRWNCKPCVSGCVDGCGRPWTPLGDLRIRRLGVRVPPGVPRKPLRWGLSHESVGVLAFWCAARDNGVMVNLRTVERDQLLLMPPSLSDWLPPDHLAWFIVDVVAELDLSSFYRSLRVDGRGGASYDPEVMLGILLYAYCVGERSSRRIEQRLCDDVAFRVVAATQAPDHATLARFRRRHQDAIAGVFSQVVALCVTEGLVRSGVVAIDGTKIEADVSAGSSATRRQIVDESLKEAEAVDATEDLEYGARRGDELPARWADRRDRRARLREALRQLDADGPSDAESYQAARIARETVLGRKFGSRRADPTTKWASAARTRRINVTDPDSRTLKDRRREPVRVFRRLHFLRGWGLWQTQRDIHRRCVSGRFVSCSSIVTSTTRSGRRSVRLLLSSGVLLRLCVTGFAGRSVIRVSGPG